MKNIFIDFTAFFFLNSTSKYFIKALYIENKGKTNFSQTASDFLVLFILSNFIFSFWKSSRVLFWYCADKEKKSFFVKSLSLKKHTFVLNFNNNQRFSKGFLN